MVYRIRITDVSNTYTYDTSDEQFAVSGLTLLRPNGGEIWKAGTAQNITWASKGIICVDIMYSTDKGATWSYATKSTISCFVVTRAKVSVTHYN